VFGFFLMKPGFSPRALRAAAWALPRLRRTFAVKESRWRAIASAALGGMAMHGLVERDWQGAARRCRLIMRDWCVAESQ
jgi:hypothetical protein